jgi:uncharacterized protein with NRDE domain
MCLILIAHRPEEQISLLVLANRDEFYSRPSAAAEYWQESPGLVAGRDLVSGGCWFGARGTRWASVTNVREGARSQKKHSKSRGWLVREYLHGDMAPADFLASIKTKTEDFAGFNLLLGDAGEIHYSTNRQGQTRSLGPGIYGLSNHLLDTPWPKVVRSKEEFNRLLSKRAFTQEGAFAILADTDRAEDADLPETGVPLEWERALSATFINMPTYGTRCSTLLMAEADGQTSFVERRYHDGPKDWQESKFTWKAQGSFLDR